MAEPIVDRLAPRKILEVGCGQGGVGFRLASRASYLGVEQDEQSFRVAEQRISPVGGRVFHGSPEDLDASETFDLLCAFEVIEHIEDDVSALRGWVSRLEPGGSVLLSTPAWPARYGAGDRMVGHYRRYAPSDIDALLIKAGCHDVRHFVYGWPLGNLLERVKNLAASRRPDRLGDSYSDRTAGSGRNFQPGRLLGMAVAIGTVPFVAIQKWRPEEGIGLVAVGTL